MSLFSQCKKSFSILLTIALLFTGIIPGMTLNSGTAYADGPITVNEAIANNTGTATVKGYIVGYFSGTGSVISDPAAISSNTNLALADNANEQDVSKMVPVQLIKTEHRNQFGLGTNKDLIGTPILVTGSLEKYFTQPGLKNPTNIEFADNPQAPNVIASPASGSVVAKGTSITLSTSVTASVYYSVYANGSDIASLQNVSYIAPIPVQEDSVVIQAYSSIPGKENSAVTTFSYTAKTPIDHLTISEIQGSGHTSPYANELVNNVEGIVTFIRDSNTVYIQSAAPDEDERTSEAIMVYKSSHGLSVGDLVQVSGQVKEWKESGYADSADLLTTEINAHSITVVSKQAELPAPTILGVGGRIMPTEFIDSDPTSFHPEIDALDFFESLEGMRVQLNTPKIVGPNDYEIPVIIDNGATNPDEVYSPAGGLVLTGADFNPQRILIVADKNISAKTGQVFTDNITGIMSYDYGNFKVRPEGKLPSVTDGISITREVTDIVYAEDKLTVASFNVENFSKSSGTQKINNIAKAIVDNLKTPDIVGLLEIQDNDGATDTGNVDASESYSALISAIKSQGGPEYAYTDIAPVNNADGGAPGANIRVGFIYNPARVSLAPGAKGDATTAVTYSAFSGLSHNPGRIDPANTAFDSSRKPLAAEFEFNGQSVIVIANHFNSKGGDSALFGSIQPPVLNSEIQRAKIAGVVNHFVKEIVTANANANIVVLGDLNDFQFSNTLSIVKGNELTNLVDTLPANERYSYVYQGNSQTLDHILVNHAIADSSTMDFVHINADFMEKDGRVSDHDPLLAQIKLQDDSDFPLTVLHTNDTHAGLDTVSSPNNILRRVTAIKEAKATTDNPILVDAGDVFSGTLYFNKYLGQADLAFMNLANYDAMTFGNHEFDKNGETSDVLSQFIGNAEFPFVSSNVNFSADDTLSQMFINEIGRSGNGGTIYPALIKEVDGEQVGIIGLTTEDTANIASPGKVVFENAFAKAEETVAMLQKENVNKIIVLSHLGYEEDLKLAKAVKGIDIIVGGHSHTQLDQAVVDHSDPNAPTLIVQTGEKGLFLGQLEVKFNNEGVLTGWKDQLISIDAKKDGSYVIAEDPEAKQILDTEYKPGIQELTNEVVGNAEVVLNGVRNDVRTKETNLGNLIADGMLYAAQKAGTKAVIALQNGGGIRESINEGPITQGEVLGVLPFNNDLVTITLTGQEIKDAMENGISKAPAADGRFPHVAGLKFYYDSTKPVNERVLSIEVKNGDKYVPLDLNASYEVATNAFTAKGGDFYTSLEKAYKEGRVNLLYLPDFDVFTKYLQEIGNVTASTSAVEGRIVDLKGAPLPETNPTPTPTPAPTSPTSPSVPSVPSVTTPSATPAPTVVPSASPQVTTISAADLTKQLAALPSGSNELIIPVKSTTGGALVELPGSVLVEQAAAQPNTVLTLTTDGASYSLPLSIVSSAALAAQLGTGDFTLTVSILLADSATLSSTNQAITSQLGNASLAGPVIEFSVTAQAGAKHVQLNNFGSTYVKRTIQVPASLNSNHASAVAYDPATGKISFVPAIFTLKADGTTEVTIKRNSNSYYTVVKSSKTFGDVNGHWAKSSIDLLASKLIITGTSNDTFAPSQSITRAEFAALITRSLGLASVNGETTFKDVNGAAWYAGAIRTAAAAGLISGYTDGTFKPGSPITRQEMASVLAKAIKFTGKTLNAEPSVLAKFNDVASIPAWSKAAITEIAAEGIIQGMNDGSFAPQKLATRAEAATMLEKTLKSLQFIN